MSPQTAIKKVAGMLVLANGRPGQKEVDSKA
jgi:hypothetical protein